MNYLISKMNIKHIIQATYIAALLLSNYLIILEYQQEYVPDNFDIYKLLDLKYRCIRYFNDNKYNRYQEHKCNTHIYDYTEFVLERSRYICLFYAYNLITGSLFLLFHLLL